MESPKAHDAPKEEAITVESERSEKSVKSEKSDKSERSEKSDKSEKSEEVSGDALSPHLSTNPDSNPDIIAGTQKKKELSSKLIDKFKENGILREVRCILISKLVTEISGVEEGLPLVPRRRHGIGGEGARDMRLQILDALILELLQWQGYHHTADMFKRESGLELTDPTHDLLESMLGPIEKTEEPVLLQLVKKRKV